MRSNRSPFDSLLRIPGENDAQASLGAAASVAAVAPTRRKPTGKRREADDDPFIQSPVSPRFRCERDSDGSHGLHVLLRHRPRSIPQAQESA